MYDKHWTDDELVARLYDVRAGDDHLAKCVSCARRLDAIRSRYDNLHPPKIDVSPEFLAEQRRSIHARIHGKRHKLPRVLVPAVVTLLVAFFVITYRPASVVPPAKAPVSDSEFFEDVFSRVSDPLPGSAGPIRSLFEEQK
jgi:hypothetical protein